jgi:hypothetical protein
MQPTDYNTLARSIRNARESIKEALGLAEAIGPQGPATTAGDKARQETLATAALFLKWDAETLEEKLEDIWATPAPTEDAGLMLCRGIEDAV